MTVGELRAALSDMSDDYEVLMAQRHWTRTVNEAGEPPLSVMMGRVDVGAEVIGLTTGQEALPYVLLCAGDVVFSRSSPCQVCGRGCVAKPAPAEEETT